MDVHAGIVEQWVRRIAEQGPRLEPADEVDA